MNNMQNNGGPNSVLWTILAIVAVAAFGTMAYFLTEYPIPVVATGSWAKNNDQLTLLIGFCAVIGGIIQYAQLQKQKKSAGIPAQIPARRPMGPLTRIYLIVAAAVWIAILAFVFFYGIMPGIEWSLQGGN